MSTIKKFIILVILVLFALSSIVAEERYSFSFSPLAGVLWGHGDEILYKFQGQDHLVSQLLWDLKPLAYAGFAVDLGPHDPFSNSGFITAGSARIGFPMRTGIMEDRDWQFVDNQNLTNFSSHDAYSQNTILADISAGYSFRLSRFFALKVFGEFSYMHHNWMAEDGYLQYLPTDENGYLDPDAIWYSNIPKVPIYGPGIRYIQNYFILNPGISLLFRASRYIWIEGTARYTPLVFALDRDDHYFTMAQFYGDYNYGHFLDGGGSVNFTPNDWLSLSLFASYRYIGGLRGNNTVHFGGVSGLHHRAGSSFINGYESGAGYSALNMGLSAKIRFAGF